MVAHSLLLANSDPNLTLDYPKKVRRLWERGLQTVAPIHAREAVEKRWMGPVVGTVVANFAVEVGILLEVHSSCLVLSGVGTFDSREDATDFASFHRCLVVTS